MATPNKMPSLEIVFKGIGTTAVQRSARGIAVLILIDSTEGNLYKEYRTLSDFTSEEQAKYTASNILFIKDALEGIPSKLVVFKMATDGVLADTLQIVGGKVKRNCWIAIQSEVAQHQNDLVTWAKAENLRNKKRYKIFGYNVTNADDKHIVNQTTTSVEFPDDRGTQTGDKAISYMLGYYAGLPLSISGIAKPLKFKSCVEPAVLDTAISNGEHVLFNDEGVVKVARAVNSIVTIQEGITVEMTHINTVEKMDLIFTDIFDTWNEYYKGKYSNVLKYQMLLISAINGYFKELANSNILDPEFENRSLVNLEAQKLANYPKYGEDVVNTWDDNKIMKMTVSTKVYLMANVKIAGIMEDLFFDIFM